MTILKNIVYLFFPFSLSICAITVGLCLLLFTSRQRLGKVIVAVGFIILVVFSNGIVARTLLGSLEFRYPSIVENAGEQFRDVRYVVVLGGMQNLQPGLPITSRINAPMMIRLVEGIRLHRQIPESKLVLSGTGNYPSDDNESDAVVMARLAGELGVDKDEMFLETKALTTYEEALELKNVVGKERFILVTSARHMPRAMVLFEKLGMSPIAAPTNHVLKINDNHDFGGFFPSLAHLSFTSEAFYEYTALLKEWLRGRI